MARRFGLCNGRERFLPWECGCREPPGRTRKRQGCGDRALDAMMAQLSSATAVTAGNDCGSYGRQMEATGPRIAPGAVRGFVAWRLDDGAVSGGQSRRRPAAAAADCGVIDTRGRTADPRVGLFVRHFLRQRVLRLRDAVAHHARRP